MNISFKTNQDILAREMIKKSKMPTEFANYLWNKYNLSYKKLQKNVCDENIDKNILKELKKQSFFKDCYQLSKQNLLRIKQNWQNNKKEIDNFLKHICNKDINLNLTCFVVYATLCSGHSNRNNTFVWGHKKGNIDKNYDMVYIVHESLHSYFKSSDLTHVVIENICDIELAKHLNKTTKGYDVHEFLKPLHKKIDPLFRAYKNENKNANSKFYNMNIDDFVKYLETTLK